MTGIRDDGHVYGHSLLDGSRIYVHVDNLCVGSKIFDLSCDSIVETRTDGE